MSDEGLRPEITRAGLPLVALALLAGEPGHGYALLSRLRERGFDRVQGGTLYPLLRRLEERGLVGHHWIHDTVGPGRKEFAITPAGREELDRARAEWERVGHALGTQGDE